MSDTTEADEPDLDSFYDHSLYDHRPNAPLTCRVCGCLVSPESGYPRVHWDWHEAANGA